MNWTICSVHFLQLMLGECDVGLPWRHRRALCGTRVVHEQAVCQHRDARRVVDLAETDIGPRSPSFVVATGSGGNSFGEIHRQRDAVEARMINRLLQLEVQLRRRRSPS